MNPHLSLFSRHPLTQLAVALSAGIGVANYFPEALMQSLIGGAICSSLALILLLLSRHSLSSSSLLMAFFFAGATLTILELRPERESDIRRLVDHGKSLTLTGVLDGPPEFARDKVYLSLRVERLEQPEKNLSGRVSLLAHFRNSVAKDDYRKLDLRYGSRVTVRTTLDRTGKYRNPGVSALTEYLDRRDYDATGIVRSPAAIVRQGDTTVFKPLALLYEWRQRLQHEIDSRFDPETAGVLDAALLGNRHNLSRTAYERFREGGTFHLLVISGLHITFLGGVVFLAVRRVSSNRLWHFLLPAAVVWSYSLAVGAGASVVRAALMFTFAGFATIVFRQSTSLNALGGAALVLLIRSPRELFDPSFQLTFLSVLAIVTIAWPLLTKFSAIGGWQPAHATPYPPACSRGLKWFCELMFWRERKWREEIALSSHDYRLFKAPMAVWLERYRLQGFLRYVFAATLVTASVQMVLLPLMIVYFHRVSLTSLVLNMVVSVLLALLVVVALLALVVSQFSAGLSAPLIKAANAIDWAMVHSVDPFSGVGLEALRLPEYSGAGALVYAFYYVPLLVLMFAVSHWRPLGSSKERNCKLSRSAPVFLLVQVLLICVLVLHPFSTGRVDGRLRVDFLDVGQGDAALVTMPDGTTLLIDGGGRPAFGSSAEAARSIGETVVSEYLWWRGLSEIDYVLATHADVDHIEGLIDVLKNFIVRGALVARTSPDDPEFAMFSRTARERGTHLETIQAGDTIQFGPVEVTVLWPPVESRGSSNNDSVVLRIEFGQRSILLTGDIEKPAEKELVALRQPLRADVVKAPHHGSKSSSTEAFVLATKPEYSIISVGRSSMFGHPHEEVVERWRASGATVLTTGKHGTITVTTNGHDLVVSTFIEP